MCVSLSVPIYSYILVIYLFINFYSYLSKVNNIITLHLSISYCVSKEQGFILYAKLLNKMGHYFLDTQYIFIYL